jgi:regulator of sirC expression with transglutaminase-like and TPR domain
MRLRQFDEAAGALEKAKNADGGNALIPYQLGLTRSFQKQWQPAFDQLSRALEMDPGLAYGYYYRGLAAQELNRNDVLVNDMSRFVELAPNAPEAERARAILRVVKK